MKILIHCDKYVNLDVAFLQKVLFTLQFTIIYSARMWIHHSPLLQVQHTC
jgi:hypothetical protein